MYKSLLLSAALQASVMAVPGARFSNVSNSIEAAAAFTLIDTYDSTNWFSKFTVQSISDPTHGFVNYVSQSVAQSTGIYEIQGNQVFIGVDTTSHLSPTGVGRNSVRIQSNPSYNHALVIGDFAHIPGSDCGAWPAFWMLGSGVWPSGGEIDIIEGVNLNTFDQITLHTNPGCAPGVGSGGETGSRTGNADCGAGGGFTGCGVVSNAATSYGTAFDANGGGVYATLWSSSAIQIWYFPASNVPADIRNGAPNPAGWGAPTANFGGCAFDSFFHDMNIVIDTTFCGDWAGAVWSSSQCASVDPSCNSYVANQPQSFGNTYWLINSIKVYSVS